MTQLEQINQEKELLKKQIQESVIKINTILDGTEMKIDIDLTFYKSEINNKTKLLKTDIDITLII